MSESTPPSQAEGDRDTADEETTGPIHHEHAEPPRTTPSQAEGDDDQDDGDSRPG